MTFFLRCNDKRSWQVEFQRAAAPPYEALYYLIRVGSLSDAQHLTHTRDSHWSVKRIREYDDLSQLLRQMLKDENRLAVETTIIDYETPSLSGGSSSTTLFERSRDTSQIKKLSDLGLDSRSLNKPQVFLDGQYGRSYIQVIEGEASSILDATVALLARAAEMDLKPAMPEVPKVASADAPPKVLKRNRLKKAQYAQPAQEPPNGWHCVAVMMVLGLAVVGAFSCLPDSVKRLCFWLVSFVLHL